MIIGNQIVTVLPGKTIIEVDYHGVYKNFIQVLNFNINEFPSKAKELRSQDYSTYYWIGTLYNQIQQRKNPKQLKLF